MTEQTDIIPVDTDTDDSEKSCCPAWLPLYFRNEPRNTIKAMIPPDRSAISVVARDSDGPTGDLGVTIGLSYNDLKQTIPAAPATLDLTPYQNKEVTFEAFGVDAEATSASLLCRLDDGEAKEDDKDLVWIPACLPVSQEWYSICYGDGKFVAVARSSDTAAYSFDGLNWETSTLPANGNWSKVRYAAGRFIALRHSSAEAAISLDGIDWTPVNMPSTASWEALGYGNGKYVALSNVSSGVTGAVSENGEDWRQVDPPVDGGFFHNIAFGNGTFVTMAERSDIALISPDGEDWSVVSLPEEARWKGLVFADGRFVATGGASGNVAASENGLDWVLSEMPPAESWNGVTHGEGRYVAVPSSGLIAADSFSGTAWNTSELPYDAGYIEVAYGNGRFVTVAYNSDKAAVGIFKDPEA